MKKNRSINGFNNFLINHYPKINIGHFISNKAYVASIYKALTTMGFTEHYLNNLSITDLKVIIIKMKDKLGILGFPKKQKSDVSSALHAYVTYARHIEGYI